MPHPYNASMAEYVKRNIIPLMIEAPRGPIPSNVGGIAPSSDPRLMEVHTDASKHTFMYSQSPDDSRSELGFIAQEILRLPPGRIKDDGVAIILPLADFQRDLKQRPAGQAVLDKYGVTEDVFTHHLINGYNELNDTEKRENYIEALLIEAGVGSLTYDELIEDLEVLNELTQTFTVTMDRHLLSQGMSLTHSTHELHAIRTIGTDGVMVNISPITSD